MAPNIQHTSDRLVSRSTNDAGFVVWPITLAGAKERSQIWHDADDGILDPEYFGIVAEAVDKIETEAHVALITQTREIVWATIPTVYQFPVYPVQAVDSITYLDRDYAEQTAADPTVTLYGYGKPPCFSQTALTLAKPVTVRYTAGFGDAASDVPARYLSIVQQTISHLWNHRDASTDAAKKFQDWFDRAIDAAGSNTRYA